MIGEIFFMFCIGLHPWEKHLLSQRKHMQNSVEDFEKVVAAVTDNKKVLVVLQKHLSMYLVKP